MSSNKRKRVRLAAGEEDDEKEEEVEDEATLREEEEEDDELQRRLNDRRNVDNERLGCACSQPSSRAAARSPECASVRVCTSDIAQ